MNDLLQISGLLIDMDGLLLDTERLSERCWLGAEAATGCVMPEGFYHSLIGQSMTQIERRLGEVMDPACDVAHFMKVAGRIYTDALTNEPVPVKPGARDLLTVLADRGVPRCLATSTGTGLCRHKLQASGLDPFLPMRVCGDEVAHSKPAPDIYLEAAARLRYAPDQLLVLEDSENGLRAALDAGCRTAHIPDVGPVSVDIQSRTDRVYRDLFGVISALERNEIVVAP